jgi:hypothetical protein
MGLPPCVVVKDVKEGRKVVKEERASRKKGCQGRKKGRNEERREEGGRAGGRKGGKDGGGEKKGGGEREQNQASRSGAWW